MLHNDVFETLMIQPSIDGGNLVSWKLRPSFSDTGSFIFTLEWAETDSGDFVPVGSSVINELMYVDPVKREFNKSLETAYRVKLETGNGIYYSEPKMAYGDWDRRSWLIARDIIRKEILRQSRYTGESGFLLKRKIFGAKCTACVSSGRTDWDTDMQLGDVETCPVCLGIGIVGGYFKPCPVVLTPTLKERSTKDLNERQGQLQPIIMHARTLAFPQFEHDDLWFSASSDIRWHVHTVSHVAEINGIQLVVDIELKQAPFTDSIYKIDLGSLSSSV